MISAPGRPRSIGRAIALLLCTVLTAVALTPSSALAQESNDLPNSELPWDEPDDSDVDRALFQGSVAAEHPCRLYRVDGNLSLSFPAFGLESTGTLRAAVLFVDFAASTYHPEPDAYYVGELFDPVIDYISHASQGRLDVELKTHPVWLTAPRPHTDYAIGGIYGPVSRSEFIAEITQIADLTFDFSDVDAIWIVAAPTPGYYVSLASFGSVVTLDGNDISADVTLMAPTSGVMTHEAMHNLGLPDLYDVSSVFGGPTSHLNPHRFVGYFDLMSRSSYYDFETDSPRSPQLLAWQRWLLGWVDDDQVDCISDLPSVTPLAIADDPTGTVAAIMRLDEHRAIVIENRRPDGADASEFGAESGLLVYLVDASIQSGHGPVVVQGERDPVFGVQSSVLLEPGESLLVAGYVIEAAVGPAGLEAHVLEACVDTMPTINMNTNGGDGIGTEGDDIIVGTAGDDVIEGRGGDDIICGGGGDDLIIGGAGDDIIRAGLGDDAVHGSLGNDVILGGQGNDRLFGQQGDDDIDGGPGDDVIHGNRGADMLEGGIGDDRIFGYADDDHISGGPGNDRLHGNYGDDIIEGGQGDDSIFGYGDNDRINGNDGDDLIVGNFGDDFLEGGHGSDLIYGSDGDDTIYGGFGMPGQASTGSDRLHGNSGNDSVVDEYRTGTVDGGIGYDGCVGAAPIRCERIV